MPARTPCAGSVLSVPLGGIIAPGTVISVPGEGLPRPGGAGAKVQHRKALALASWPRQQRGLHTRSRVGAASLAGSPLVVQAQPRRAAR